MSYYSRRLLIGTIGIYATYISMSYLAQNLFNTKFRSINLKTNEQTFQKFQYPSLVTWIGCLLCSIYGLCYAHFVDKQPNLITHKERIRLGLLFTLNYLPTNYSLLYISYPLQVITKNTRYILVVIVGVFFSRVRKSKELKLPMSKLFIGIFITIGAGLFMYYQTKKQVKQFDLDPYKRWIGYILLLLAVVCDALFSDNQAYCKATFKPTPNQLFLAANLYGFMFIFAFSIIIGELRTSIIFCIKHPIILIQLILIGCLQVMGQISVYYVISNFKQHIYPLISTTRKIFTILVSIVAFNHKLNLDQWFALAIVFLSMAYELYDQIKSQEYHRQIRKIKLQKSVLQESQHHQGKLIQSQSRKTDSQPQSQIQDADYENKNNNEKSTQQVKNNDSLLKSQSSHNSRANKSHRVNRFINNALLIGGYQNKIEDQSLSKYRYNWRVGELVQDKETSLTPIKKIKDI